MDQNIFFSRIQYLILLELKSPKHITLSIYFNITKKPKTILS
jgi:hypothetical protein